MVNPPVKPRILRNVTEDSQLLRPEVGIPGISREEREIKCKGSRAQIERRGRYRIKWPS